MSPSRTEAEDEDCPYAAYKKRTQAADERFFNRLGDGASVTEACADAGYTRQVVYRWRKFDRDFDERWVDALQIAYDLALEEADRRGRDGGDEPVYYKGKLVGQRRRYSDRLLLVRIQAGRPVYRPPAY
ncbi:MAG: hypothetical protein ABL973_19490 [Micropepsaceae bacterium]